MDRFDLWSVFLAVADKGSFVGAARHLNRSPAAVTRAVAALEDHLAVRLLTRTTRSVALTEAGERYMDMCRRLLADIRETEAELAGEGGELHGNLAITAPVVFGRLHLLPLVDEFMAAHPRLTVSLALLDRQVSLVEEGLDIALRIGALRDSSLRAVRVGGVRRVVCATPDYLARHGTPRTPHDLAGHRVIAFTGVQRQPERWPFVFPEGEVSVAVTPRLLVNSVEAALDAVVRGGGISRVLSYQIAALEQAGKVVRLLQPWEPPALPVHLVFPTGRHLPRKVRVFIDTVAPILRARFGDD